MTSQPETTKQKSKKGQETVTAGEESQNSSDEFKTL